MFYVAPTGCVGLLEQCRYRYLAFLGGAGSLRAEREAIQAPPTHRGSSTNCFAARWCLRMSPASRFSGLSVLA